jgi:hypothetical protein
VVLPRGGGEMTQLVAAKAKFNARGRTNGTNGLERWKEIPLAFFR